MNKKEKDILLNSYKNVCYSLLNGFNEYKNTKKQYSFLLNSLGLRKDKYIIENQALFLADINLNKEIENIFFNLFDIFSKYNSFILFDINLNNIYETYEDLQYNFTNSEKELYCNNIMLLKNEIKKALIY